MSYPQIDAMNVARKVVTLVTSKGSIQIELFPELTPRTVENFLTHAQEGYYDGVPFHRVIRDFMIQTGDPEGTGMGGESIWGSPFDDELSDRLFNFRGALSMANAGPNTNGSQFFIVQASTIPKQIHRQLERYPVEVKEYYLKHGGAPWLDGKHSVFGQVIEGMDVVDKIAKCKTDMYDQPKKKIVIQHIDIGNSWFQFIYFE